jgi:hypothetical protein
LRERRLELGHWRLWRRQPSPSGPEKLHVALILAAELGEGATAVHVIIVGRNLRLLDAGYRNVGGGDRG